MFRTIKRIVEDNSTKGGRAFDCCIQVLIVVSIISFSIETMPNLSARAIRILNYIETAIVLIFTLEYLLRIIVADKRSKFIFSFFGIIDLLAIAPFYLTIGVDLRSLRVFRLLRLFRIIKLARYNKALQRIQEAYIDSKEEFVLFFSATLMLLFISAVGIYYFENPHQPEAFSSIFDSLWWAVATLTTVGYGDVYPISVGGRIFTFMVLIIGLAIVAVPAGIISSSLTKVRRSENETSENE